MATRPMGGRKPASDTQPVLVPCPRCEHNNYFWGYADDDGHVYEHFGRKCKGAILDPETLEITPCGFRFRFKLCHACEAENDVTARECERCNAVLVDADAKLKQARLSKNAHVLTPDKITFEERQDKNFKPYLEIRYYDADAQYLSEAHFFSHPTSLKKFNINFLRSHLRRPELADEFKSPADVVKYQKLFRLIGPRNRVSLASIIVRHAEVRPDPRLQSSVSAPFLRRYLIDE